MANAIDPDAVINDPDMVYFRGRGLKDLVISMIKQSVQDLVDLKNCKKTTYDPREQQCSANWLQTEAGKQCLHFVMPDVSAEAAVARIYEDPQAILSALKRVDAEANDITHSSNDYCLSGGLDLSGLEDIPS